MRFAFEPNSLPSTCYVQVAKSILKIPRFTGKPPPAYPGKQPLSSNINKFKSWCTKAKLFVEYYTLLFIPFNVKYEFPTPYNQILPWNTSTSWHTFWKIFNGFKN